MAERTNGFSLGIFVIVGALLAGCVGNSTSMKPSGGEIKLAGQDEFLVIQPFRLVTNEVPDEIVTLASEVSTWLEERPHVYQSERTYVKITSDGEAVIAWTETFLEFDILECKVWTRNATGAWVGRSIELDKSPYLKKCSGSFLYASTREILDLREDPPVRLGWPEHLRFIGMTPEGNWIAAQGGQIVCGTLQDGQFQAEFSSHAPAGVFLQDSNRGSVYWLYDYKVGILKGAGGESAIIDFVRQTVRPLGLARTPLIALGHPAKDRLICHANKGYVVVQISREGEVKKVRSNWSVQSGDQLWATSPSGVFIGGRRWALINLLPGGYGPNVIRVNRNLAPKRTKNPRLGGADFVGWLRHGPAVDPLTR